MKYSRQHLLFYFVPQCYKHIVCNKTIFFLLSITLRGWRGVCKQSGGSIWGSIRPGSTSSTSCPTVKVKTDRHINKKLNCPKYPKSFQCKQSLDCHMLTKHTKKANVCHSWELCDKTFVAKVALENPLRFVHSDERKFSCDQCKTKFKKRKHLHNHALYVYGFNQKKEDYWQDLPKKDFECDLCKSKFIRKQIWKPM